MFIKIKTITFFIKIENITINLIFVLKKLYQILIEYNIIENKKYGFNYKTIKTKFNLKLEKIILYKTKN